MVLVIVAAYLPAPRGGFVFDDHRLIGTDPMVKTGDGKLASDLRRLP